EGGLSVRFLRESRVLPLAEQDGAIVLAMANPLDRYAIDAIRLMIGREVVARVAVPAELDAAIERLYGQAAAAAPLAGEAAGRAVGGGGGGGRGGRAAGAGRRAAARFGERGPGHPPRQPADRARRRAARLGHPHRAVRGPRARALPHRRCVARGRAAGAAA